MRTAKTLIRLGGCPGWTESSLGAHTFCWFCHAATHLTSVGRKQRNVLQGRIFYVLDSVNTKHSDFNQIFGNLSSGRADSYKYRPIVKMSVCFLNVSLTQFWTLVHNLTFQIGFACRTLYLSESDFDPKGLYHFYWRLFHNKPAPNVTKQPTIQSRFYGLFLLFYGMKKHWMLTHFLKFAE